MNERQREIIQEMQQANERMAQTPVSTDDKVRFLRRPPNQRLTQFDELVVKLGGKVRRSSK